MACLNISLGLFVNVSPPWRGDVENGVSGVQDVTDNGAAVNNLNGVCTISRGEFFTTVDAPAFGSVFFKVFGVPRNFVAVMTKSSGANPEHAVFIVDVTGPSPVRSEVLIRSALEPGLQPSSGDGSVCLLIGGDNSGGMRASFRRSDNGVDLGTIPDPFTVGDGHAVIGNASETHLQVLEFGVRVVEEFDRPTGVCAVEPSTLSFEDAVVEQGVTLIPRTLPATIRNVGTDCLLIEGVDDVGPYAVTGVSPAFPVTLDPGDEVNFNVTLAPDTTGSFNLGLPINPSPANGAPLVLCVGTGRPPIRSIQFPANIDFGHVPVSTTQSLPLTIQNTGEVVVNLTNFQLTPPEYSMLTAPAPQLQPGASTPPQIQFRPNGQGSFSGRLDFESDLPSSPHRVTLNGEGCVPEPVIEVVEHAPDTFINFGEVERGFRTVRMVTVRNTGDGTLNFTARIIPPTTPGQDSLFGLQRENRDIMFPESELSVTVEPTSRCGPGATGSGEFLFAVTFFANGDDGRQEEELVITHNVAGLGPLRFGLAAEIIPAVSVDVELVLDRSGSMAEDPGGRSKIETALAASQLFVDMTRTDAGDRMGLVSFNNMPGTVHNIAVIDEESKVELSNALNTNTFEPQNGTAIAGGIIEAVRDLAAHPRPEPPSEFKQVLIVLTDANDNTPYVNPDDNQSYTLLGENDTLPVPVPPGVSLYGVGIGEDVDIARLAQLCPTTGGQYLHVRDFSGRDFFKLEKHFTQIYMAVRGNMEQLLDPTTRIQPQDRHEHPFEVLRGDVSIMVVIYDRDFVRLPFYLQTPRGETIEPGSIPSEFQIRPGITDTARFIELRLPQGQFNRYAGTWKLVVSHDGMLCRAPGVPAGARWLKEPSQTIVGAGKEAKTLKFSFGFKPEKCDDGTKEPVMYGFVIGVGSNFRMAPFVEPSVKRVGEPIQLNALVSEFGLPVTRCDVTVTATTPSGDTHTLNLRDDGTHRDNEENDGDYGGAYTYTNQEGMYEFLFRARGRSRDGEPVLREATLSKYVEGRKKFFPPNGGKTDDKYYGRVERWLRVLAYLLGVGLFLLILVLLWKLK
jgi:von Willebrand factor type A domain-containing protein/HYDIN/CFA65/VesB family protein